VALAHSICMCPCADCTHIHVFLAPAHGNATFLFHMPIKYFTITYFITTYFTLTFKFMHMAPVTVAQFTCQVRGKFSSVLPAAMKLVQQVLFYALFFWSLKKARGAPKRHKAFKVEPEEGLITEAHQKNFAGHLLDICMGNRLSAPSRPKSFSSQYFDTHPCRYLRLRSGLHTLMTDRVYSVSQAC